MAGVATLECQCATPALNLLWNGHEADLSCGYAPSTFAAAPVAPPWHDRMAITSPGRIGGAKRIQCNVQGIGDSVLTTLIHHGFGLLNPYKFNGAAALLWSGHYPNFAYADHSKDLPV